MGPGVVGGAPVVAPVAAPLAAPLAAPVVAPLTLMDKLRMVERDSKRAQASLDYFQDAVHPDDGEMGVNGIGGYEQCVVANEEVVVFSVGQIFMIPVMSRVTALGIQEYHQEDVIMYEEDENFFSLEGVINNCAMYPFQVTHVTPRQHGDKHTTLAGILREGLPPGDSDEAADPNGTTFPLWDTAARAEGGHVISPGAVVSIVWKDEYVQLITPSRNLAAAMEVHYQPAASLGMLRETTHLTGSTSLHKGKLDPDQIMLECKGERATFEVDMADSQGFRRGLEKGKALTFLGARGCVIDAAKIRERLINAHSGDPAHAPAWLTPDNHVTALLSTPAFNDTKKFDQFLKHKVNTNNLDPEEFFAFQDLLPVGMKHDDQSIEGLGISLSNFDKIRAMSTDRGFAGVSNDLIAEIASGVWSRRFAPHVHYVAHQALAQYATVMQDPANSRFLHHPAGEAVRVWRDTIKTMFTVTYFDEVRADWSALQKKREDLKISLKRLAGVKPGKDTDKEPKKPKRSAVAEQDLLCTVQAKFDLKSPQSAAKACSLAKCPNKHAKLHEMTKPLALASIKSSASAKSYKGLTELARAYFG